MIVTDCQKIVKEMLVVPEDRRRFSIIRLEPISGLSTRLKSFGTRKIFKAGTVLFWETEEINNIYIVEDGLVEIAVVSKMGELKTIALCPPGVIIGEMGLFSNYLNTAHSTVLIKSTLNIVTIDRMRKAFSEDDEISAGVFNSVASKLQLTTNQLGIMTMGTLEAQIANILLDYRQSEIPLSQERLAAMVGCSRITITRHLNQMQDQKIIQLKRGVIVILNRSLLEMTVDLK